MAIITKDITVKYNRVNAHAPYTDMVVEYLSDLDTIINYGKSYAGMIVVVTSELNDENNGAYYLNKTQDTWVNIGGIASVTETTVTIEFDYENLGVGAGETLADALAAVDGFILSQNTFNNSIKNVAVTGSHTDLLNQNANARYQHIDSTTEKTIPVDADKIAIWDSVSLKYVSIVWSTLITFLKTIFQPIEREIIDFRSDASTDDYAIITREYAYYIASIPSGFTIKHTNGTNYVANTNVAADTNLYVYASVFPSKCKLTLSRQ